MAGTSIQLKDTRLLLFQALERGSFEGSFFERMEKDGAGMSYEFAKKYYKVTFEAYLIAASYCVLGVINVGLINLSNDDVELAVNILKTKSLMEIFQAGWAKVSELADIKILKDDQWSVKSVTGERKKFSPIIPQKETIWHREIAERLSAEPGRIWTGKDELAKLEKETSSFAGDYNLSVFIRDKFAAHNPNAGKPGIYKVELNLTEVMLDTYYLSLLISGVPKAPMEISDLDKITQLLTDKQISKKYKAKWLNFSEIPKELMPFHQEKVTAMAKTIKYFQQILATEGESELYTHYYTRLYILADANKASEQMYTSAKETIRLRSDGDIGALINSLYGETDASVKLAIVDLLLEKPERLSAENILNILEVENTHWQKKLAWYKLPAKTIIEVLESDVQDKIISDIFAQHQESLMMSFWEKLPGALLLKLMIQYTNLRDFLLDNLLIDYDFLKSRDVSVDARILFIRPHNWPKMWELMETIHAPVIFERFKKFCLEIGFSRAKTNNLLWERILEIGRYYRDKTDLPEFEKCDEPFYSDFLKEAVEKAHTKEGFRKISQKLKKALK